MKRVTIKMLVTSACIAWATSIALHGFTGYWETNCYVMFIEFVFSLSCLTVWML